VDTIDPATKKLLLDKRQRSNGSIKLWRKFEFRQPAKLDWVSALRLVNNGSYSIKINVSDAL